MSTISSSLPSNAQWASMQSKLLDISDPDGDGSVGQDQSVSSGSPTNVNANMAANASGTREMSLADYLNAVTSEDTVSGLSARTTSGVMSMMMDWQTSSSGSASANSTASTSSSNPSSVSDLFSELDNDGDGKVTQAEFLASKPENVSTEQATRLFSAMDTGGTGSITEEQLADMMKKAESDSGARGGVKGAGGHHHHGGQAEAATGSGDSGASNAPDIFSSLDTNGDGVISESELMAANQGKATTEQANELSNTIDTNGTGSFTQDDLSAAMQSQVPSAPPSASSPSEGAAPASSSASSADGGATDSNSIADDILKQLISVIQNFNANYTDASSTVSAATGSLVDAG